MNERFKELKLDAVINGGDTSHIDYDKMWHDERRKLEDLAVEKYFAELIVRECVDQGEILAKHYINSRP